MAAEDNSSLLELIKHLGERMTILSRMQADFMKQMAERAALAARMYAETMKEFVAVPS